MTCMLATLLVLACASDSSKSHDLVGYWQLDGATVEGEDTDRLNELYFDFGADGLLETNIFGVAGKYAYEWQRGRIDQLGEPSLEYEIEWLSDSTIALQTEIRNKVFVLSLVRAEMLTESSEIIQ